MNQIDFLRLDRAEAFMRIKGEFRPMQVETLRLMQASADRAYDRGIKLLCAGRLRVLLSEEEALGNYIDRGGSGGIEGTLCERPHRLLRERSGAHKSARAKAKLKDDEGEVTGD